MNMNRFGSILSVCAIVLATPAAAVVPLVNSPITVTSANIGQTFSYTYNGIVNEQTIIGLSSRLTFRLNSIVGKRWNFTAFVNNTLNSAPISARITGFGFSGNPEITGATPGAGPFGTAVIDAGFPQIGGKTSVDFCLTSGNNCSGGAGGGVLKNTTATQEFALSFANNTTSVIFNNFIVRYQAITGVRQGNSGIGMGSLSDDFDPGGDPVPEPASWAMLIAGFGLIGAIARRQRAAVA